ncbi:MAG: Riboflavin biosynthesis protein RibF [Phycisphaerae bacterium]|nr:Riboflavin biosynthesis protein RibF [Phycisphaerae bacterium]
MAIVYGLPATPPVPEGVVLCVGNFDGVHLGHQAILRTARQVAAASGGLCVTAMTFEPHPWQVLAPQRAPARLTRAADKFELLRASGADRVVVLRSERKLLEQPALQFLEEVVHRCGVRAFVEGPTFMFGRGREGNVQLLAEHAQRLGYALTVTPTLTCDALPGSPAINSSAIRAKLAAGEVRAARFMLGRPHVVSGVVVSGDGRGKTLGFPTANLSGIEQMIPGDGVYAAIAEVPGAAAEALRRGAAVNIGPQPTFGGGRRRVEAHLLDFSGDLYGRTTRLQLRERLRGQERFESADALRAQLAQDVARVREVVA